MRFDWNQTKASTNFKKHGVTFEQARTVFFDEFAVQFFDEDHSSDEERFLLLGLSSDAKLLLVCHCERERERERERGDVVRIISARKATKREAAHYTRYLA